jgi:hypothetical protein
MLENSKHRRSHKVRINKYSKDVITMLSGLPDSHDHGCAMPREWRLVILLVLASRAQQTVYYTHTSKA